MKTPELEFMSKESRGLILVERGRREAVTLRLSREGSMPLSGWVRRGPIAAGLRFQGGINSPNGANLRTTVDLTFVNSKSWIEGIWTVEDPRDQVEAMGLDLRLRLENTPVLVDCGASSTIYGHLLKNETLTFTGFPPTQKPAANRRWIIQQGDGSGRKPRAISRQDDRAPEGWIHVMDSERCSALAVDRFASTGIDRFLVDSNGRVEFERRFQPDPAPANPRKLKSLRFWLHEVPMPVQVGAVTSPQAILSPLVAEWVD